MTDVLVVDDDREIRDTLRCILEDESYRVWEAEDGVHALALLRRSAQPLVVLFDLRMPRMDGLALLTAISRDVALSMTHTFILMTAEYGMQTLAFAPLLKQLAVPVISKPFDLNHLLEIVHIAELRLRVLQRRFAPRIVEEMQSGQVRAKGMADNEARAPLLMVEDSDVDYDTFVWAMRRRGVTRPIMHCSDGDEALDALFGRGAYAQQTPITPSLVLLDLNLLTEDGRNVLEEIKGDARLRSVPVIVWTGSSDPRDVQLCYKRGANSYIVKPTNGEQFRDAVHLLESYWLQIVTLPSGVSRRDGDELTMRKEASS